MSGRIRALELRLSPHRVLAALTAGRLRDDVRHGGTLSPLRLVDLPRPERRPGWVRIAPRLSGICGSDRKYLDITGLGLPLTALYGFPRNGVVLGHEIVGTVLEADADAGVSVGDRVVAEPTLGCADKGFVPCRRCARGDDHLCARIAERGTLTRGHGFGFDARYGGGWAEELVAPAAHVRRVPDDLDDRAAVLTEPMAVAVHAVLREPPPPGARVVVIGPGPVGLCVTMALETLVPDVHVTVVGLDPGTDDLAVRAGAEEVVHGTRRDLVEAVGRLVDTPVRGSRVSGPLLEHGVDVVYDVVGSDQTIDDTFRMLRPGGELVLLATAGAQRVDWSYLWQRELRVRGAGYYADEDVPGRGPLAPGRRRAFDVALEVLGEHRPGHLVTHVFPLDEPVEALATSAAGPERRAVKVAFAPRG